MEEIYPICLARQDSRPAALQSTSICWIKSLQRMVMVCRCWDAGVYQRTSHESLTINVIWGNLTPSKTMKKYLKTASLLNQNWASGFNSAVVLKSRPTSSSRYSSATVGTRLSQVRLIFFNCRLEDPKNPWTPSSKVQTIDRNHTASKHSKKKNLWHRTEIKGKAHARQIVTVLSCDGGRVCQKRAATSCPCSPQWGHVEKLGILMGKWENIKELACMTGIQVILKGGSCVVSIPDHNMVLI